MKLSESAGQDSAGATTWQFCFWCFSSFLLCMPLLVLLFFGWIYFPIRTLPQMTFEPAALLVGAAAFVVLVAIAHWLCRWLYGHFPAASATPRPWRLRWTASIVVMASALLRHRHRHDCHRPPNRLDRNGERPIITTSMREVLARITSTNLLKQIGRAMYNYEQRHGRFPPGGTVNSAGLPMHSWETLLLPYLEAGQVKPNMNLPWDHPENAECFKTEMREFLNHGVSSDHRTDDRGYALSHYSVNSHVLGLNRAIPRKEATDGTANTIFGGEINNRFPPWGYPINWRDPALGINKSPNGFGGPWRTEEQISSSWTVPSSS